MKASPGTGTESRLQAAPGCVPANRVNAELQTVRLAHRKYAQPLINTGLQPGVGWEREVKAVSTALTCRTKPLKRLLAPQSSHTGLKPGVNERRRIAPEVLAVWLFMLVFASFVFTSQAQTTNHTPEATKPVEHATSTDTSSQGFSESSFRIVSDRNIFNANRSGGTVQTSRSSRSTRVESFALVGTMAYEKGAYAFFEGSGSELTKVLKPDGVIAGHKLVDIYANAVKLEYDGKEIEMPVGCQMRREDQGSWHMTEASSGGGSTVAYTERSSSNGNGSTNGDRYRSSRDRGSNGDSRSRSRDYGSSRGRESSESRSPSPPASTSTSNESESETLKRLMERREKDSQ